MTDQQTLEEKIAYRQAAVQYNRDFAEFAKERSEAYEHPVMKKWAVGISRQHTFHQKRHQRVLARLMETLNKLEVQTVPDLTGGALEGSMTVQGTIAESAEGDPPENSSEGVGTEASNETQQAGANA